MLAALVRSASLSLSPFEPASLPLLRLHNRYDRVLDYEYLHFLWWTTAVCSHSPTPWAKDTSTYLAWHHTYLPALFVGKTGLPASSLQWIIINFTHAKQLMSSSAWSLVFLIPRGSDYILCWSFDASVMIMKLIVLWYIKEDLYMYVFFFLSEYVLLCVN